MTRSFKPLDRRFPVALAVLLVGCGGDAESAPGGEGVGSIPATEFPSAVEATEVDAAPDLPSSSVPLSEASESAATTPRASSALPVTPREPSQDEAADASSPVPEPAEPIPSADPPPAVIPAGTLIPAVMQVGLSTRTHQAGDVFHARVSEEILAEDGMVLVPEGTRIEGRVAQSRQSERSDEEALLLLTFEALVIRGDRYPVDAAVTDADLEASAQASGARTAATVATGAAAGAVVGRILGGSTRSTIGGAAAGAIAGAGVALTTRDGHAEIREGARLVIRLESPTVLTPP